MLVAESFTPSMLRAGQFEVAIFFTSNQQSSFLGVQLAERQTKSFGLVRIERPRFL